MKLGYVLYIQWAIILNFYRATHAFLIQNESLRAKNTVSKHKSKYELQNFPVGLLSAPSPTSYLHYVTNHNCQRRSCFTWILPNMQ